MNYQPTMIQPQITAGNPNNSLNGQDPVVKETILSIIMDTNIPGQSKITFTTSMLNAEGINKSGFSDKPYLTSEFEYPVSILKSLSYQEQLNFFFKKTEFIRILKFTPEYNDKLKEYMELKRIEQEKYAKGLHSTAESRKKELREKREKELTLNKKRNETSRKNIMTMLELLFPTKTYNRVTNTFDNIFKGTISSSFSISAVMPMIMSLFLGVKDTSQQYSYLEIGGGGIYTITQIIWLNDIYNHPQYKLLVEEYERYHRNMYDTLGKQEDMLDILKSTYQVDFSNTIQSIKNIPDIDVGNRPSYSNTSSEREYSRQLTLLKETVGKLDYSNLKITVKTISDLQRSSYYPFRNIPIFETFLNRTRKILEVAELVDYLEHPTIISDSTTTMQTVEERERNTRLRSSTVFNQIQKFMQIVDKLIKTPSTNIYLQGELIKYASKRGENKIDTLMHPEKSKESENIQFVDSGITIENGMSTIYLRVDVIGGKIDDSNKGQIACAFNGESLGDELRLLITPNKKFWEIDKNRFYFDLKTASSVILDENKKEILSPDAPVKEKPLANNPNIKKTNPKIARNTFKRGGKKHRRHNKTQRK
jgi:hypothetical protein